MTERLVQMGDPPKELLELVRATAPSPRIPPEVFREVRNSLPGPSSGGGGWKGPTLALSIVVGAGLVTWMVVPSEAPDRAQSTTATAVTEPAPVASPSPSPEVEVEAAPEVRSAVETEPEVATAPEPGPEGRFRGTSDTPPGDGLWGLSPDPAHTRRAASGTLVVNSDPWSVVSVDGRRIGNTPITSHRIQAGPHRVRLVSESGQTRTQRVLVRAGETTRVVVRLPSRREERREPGSLRLSPF